MSSIEEQVKSIVAEQLGVKEEEVTNDASFVDDLGADSLDTVELVMALEEEFETEIPDEEAEKDHHGSAGHRFRNRSSAATTANKSDPVAMIATARSISFQAWQSPKRPFIRKKLRH